MSHTPHELMEEFPEQIEKIHKLKSDSVHFARLFDEYHVINRAVHRAETNIEPTDDLHLARMRKHRLSLKDAVAAALKNA